MSERRVVVTGLGIVCATGIGTERLWHHLKLGRSAITYLKEFDRPPFANAFAGRVPDLNVSEFMSPKLVRGNGRATHLAMIAAKLAIEDSAIDMSLLDRDRIGVIVGSSAGNIGYAEEQYGIIYEKGFQRASPFFITAIHPASLSAHIGVAHGFRGPSESIQTACASGASAIGLAYRYLKAGLADIMIAGGSEAPLTPYINGGFSVLGILSKRKDNPLTAMRPFSADRDGLILAEGAAVLVLEEYRSAKRCNRGIYSEIVGYGTTSDGFHRLVQAPDGEQYARAIRLALEEADAYVSDVDYIIPHASATRKNDPAETAVIRKVFGGHADRVSISASKPIMGHSLGACGAIEAVVLNLCMREQFAHPTINYFHPDPACDLDYTPNVGHPLKIKAGLSINCGFGGVNTAILFKSIKE